MNSFQPSARNAVTAQLSAAPFDIVIIGGGIVGAGVARDAAMRGLKTLVVDQGDFASGTSSRSSRLLHGGLRYLAQGRVGLVREASVEKKIIHHIAPHLATALPFVFPTYRGSDWPKWQLAIGVKMYDLLCSGRNLGPSSSMSKEKTLQRVPGLKADNLTGAARYFDGFTNDSRLVLDTLRSAARQGANVLNYTKFLDSRKQDSLWECRLQDVLTGEEFTVRTRSIVNATGPWAQQIPHSSVRLRLSKGVHLVIPAARVPVSEAVVITEGKRILFVIPWGERVIVGTTDTDYNGKPEEVTTDTADISYLLATLNSFFPSARLSANDIISTWAGVRPLIANADGSPSDISRAHQIKQVQPGWWDVAGGKLTTYRLMAEQTVDQVAAFLKKPKVKSRTAIEPLLMHEQINPFSSTVPPAVSRPAVEHFIKEEWAVHLTDVMLRRSSWHYYESDADRVASEVGTWMAEINGWSSPRLDAELTLYRTEVHSALQTASSR